MGFRGLNSTQAPKLAAAMAVASGAVSIQGGMIRNILIRWEGRDDELNGFPSKATWANDQSEDINRRLGILETDPEATLMFAGLGGVLETWEKFQNSDELERYQDTRKDVITPLKVIKIPTAIEASMQLYQRWQQGHNVAGARAVFELNKYFGVSADRLKLKRADLLRELLKDQAIRNLYKEPWKWQQAVRGLAQRLRIPGAAKLFQNAPGTGFLATRVILPLNIVTGAKEMIMPTHDGAQGWVDRGMGGVQVAGAVAVLGGPGLATALGLSAAAVPVVGWVALGVAGAYFLGSWAWDKWGDDIKAGVGRAWEGTKNFAKKLKFW